MAKTVQELIEEGKARDELFKQARKGIRKERVQKVKGFVKKGFTAQVSPKVGKRVSVSARKAINLLAPKGSFIQKITQTGKKVSGRGRGRPKQTFKTRVLPLSGRVVKVPTHIYKKMVSQEKAAFKLAQAQKQAILQQQAQADQIAMKTDPRFQGGVDEQFLSEQDPLHEMRLAQMQQDSQRQAQMEQFEQLQPRQQGNGFVQRIARGVNRLGTPRRVQPQMIDEFGRPQQPQFSVQDMRPRSPRVTAISDKASLLTVPNIFNNPGQSDLSRRRL